MSGVEAIASTLFSVCHETKNRTATMIASTKIRPITSAPNRTTAGDRPDRRGIVIGVLVVRATEDGSEWSPARRLEGAAHGRPNGRHSTRASHGTALCTGRARAVGVAR